MFVQHFFCCLFRLICHKQGKKLNVIATLLYREIRLLICKRNSNSELFHEG